jgi:hypothetical protein
LSHASGLTNGVIENISEHAGGSCFFGVLAGSAGEIEAVGFWVFFGVQHVGTEDVSISPQWYTRAKTCHSLQKRKVICSIFLVSSPVLDAGEAMIEVF